MLETEDDPRTLAALESRFDDEERAAWSIFAPRGLSD